MAQSATFTHFDVIQHIGCGFSAEYDNHAAFHYVQLLQQKFSGQLFALKVFKAKQSMLYENEKKIMEELSHCPGVIQIEDQSEEPLDRCILMEYAAQGSMLNFLKFKPLPEPVSRAYFRQLLQILESIHQRGIVHRDIKLENMLLDEDYKLKMCDFGFAAKYIDGQGKKIKMSEYQLLFIWQDTLALSKQPLPSCVEADLFQMGVVLFQISTGSAPFKSANISQDPLYQLIYKNQASKFWQSHETRLGNGYFSKELKDLLQRLMAYNPNQRLSISEIKQHPWMKMSDASQEDITSTMKISKTDNLGN